MKASSIFLSSCHYGFQSVHLNPPSTSSTSSLWLSSVRHPQPPSPRCRRWPSHLPQRNTYATVADDDHEPHQWPQAERPGTLPTPYQILHLQRGAPYSKRRFYELVKLYHPDRCKHRDEDVEVLRLPHSVRLDRYRLIVAAHEILSDPIKRNAYDQYGAGWNGAASVRGWQGGGVRSTTTNWSGGHSPHYNATWEDWEKWYERSNGKSKQEPVFMENSTFLSFIIVFAMMGGMVETIRARSFSMAFTEHRDRLNDAAFQELSRARKEADSKKDRRIQQFLHLRGPGMMDASEEQQTTRPRRMLPDAEVCSGNDINRGDD
ncbi:MAG: Metallothionein expression activator [Watsoniomyces obsoletus]|nr:MAG: Metallothionein expression activator [Watsoniomyces obsoletus]